MYVLKKVDLHEKKKDALTRQSLFSRLTSYFLNKKIFLINEAFWK